MPAKSLKPIAKDEFDYWKAQHLLNRAGFGGTPSQARGLANLGLDAAVAHLVDYAALPTEAVAADRFDRNIMQPRTDAQRTALRRARQRGDEAVVEQARSERQERQRSDRRQVGAIRQWWLRRMIETARPLEEKMTLFWHGHFATGYRAIEDSYHMFLQNQLFRSHAVGNFRDLTRGIIHDPAMLAYLNNNRNRRQAPNENLARELMELFTLGEGNEYTEQDIKEGARALTGYTFNDDEFVFRRNQHDDGAKRILGRSGNWDGDDFVGIIFSRPIVSEFLCWKLYRFFVNDLPGTPPPEARRFIIAMARELRDADWNLKPVLTLLFKSRHFYDDANTASQIKSPVQLVVQAIRSLHTPTRKLSALLSATELMGQNLLFPPSVKGWDGGRAWINTATMYVRQNLLIYLLTGLRPDAYPWDADGARYDAMHLVAHLDERGGDVDVREVVTYLLRFNLGKEPAHERVSTLVSFVEDNGGRIDNAMLIALLSLITAMPEYQLC